MTAPHELRTERLLLRSFRPADIPHLVRLAGAREVAATTLQIPHPYTRADARQFIALRGAECRHGQAVKFAVVLIKRNELCGAIGLRIDGDHKRAELGFWIGVPYWGHGYSTEAAQAVVAYGFDLLKLHRIHASCFKGNLASQRVLKKLAMRYEGCSREHVRKWEKFVDLEHYGLLATEFKGRAGPLT